MRSSLLFACLISAAAILLSTYPSDVLPQDKGIVTGVVLDAETLSPVEDARVELLGSGIEMNTDSAGWFSFSGLSYNSYGVRISRTGYEAQIKSDLVLYASKPLELRILLEPRGITTGPIDVTANFFQRSSDVNISSMNLDFEEIRRAPGATEDISRMLQSAPGVAIGNDQRNDIIVRGGSPAENLILIDGVEVPNINHFGSDGSTSGAIGFINTKFIYETNLLTGGFPVLYGDKLSGVVDISFRDGSKKNFFGDINLSIAGFGGLFEGPISENGSYLVSVRRSYLELLKNSIRLTSVPNYWDVNLKTTYSFSPTDKVSLIGLLGLDKIDFSGESAENNPYGNSLNNQNTLATGVNYTKLLRKGYWENVISDAYADTYVKQIDSRTANPNFIYDARNNEVICRSNLNYALSRTVTLNAGVGGKFASVNSSMFLKGDTNAAGYYYDTINAVSEFNTYKLFGHANVTGKLLNDRLTVNAGARIDYFEYIDLKAYFSPRAGLSYKVTPVTQFNLAGGIYFQSPEYIWLSADPRNKALNSIRCSHIIAGLEHYFMADLKASVEFYYKEYKDYAVWKDIPTYILVDGGTDFGPNIVGEAVSAGKGIVRGIDFSIHKKLSGYGLYGLLNYSFIHSGFSALEGGVKPGAFDPGHVLTLIAGYQLRNGWLAGIKFKYNGGRPYTPIDEQASFAVNRAVYATDDFNSSRYPYYMRFDVRVDKKFDFSKSSLVAYLELQNVFNRENIYSYYWDDFDRNLETIYQWAFLPVVGISMQF
ncbi:MAG: TonB-dependent receptor [Ignavibacteria bacterium]|nr:TonB-dependent receptor [Ignavibacteria bacterium]